MDRSQRPREVDVLTYGGALYGQMEINRPGDDLFLGEIEEPKEEAEEGAAKGRKTVLKALAETKAIVAIQVLWQDREAEGTLQKIDPIWLWLFANRSGLLQVDGEGWYDRSGLILKLE